MRGGIGSKLRRAGRQRQTVAYQLFINLSRIENIEQQELSK